MRREIKDECLICLIERFLKIDIYWNQRITTKSIGVVQGSSLSPLLANIYLNELDKELERKRIPFIRYADDILIFERSIRLANSAYIEAKGILKRKLNMTFSSEKTEKCCRTQVTFLGYKIKRVRNRYVLYVSDKAERKLEDAMNSLWRKPEEKRIEWMGSFNRGWINYYQYADDAQLYRLSSFADGRQRAQIGRLLKHLNRQERDFILGYSYHYVPMTQWRKTVNARRKNRK